MPIGRLVNENLSIVGGYLALVGAPVLAIILALRAGGGIAAPVSIDGSWVMESAPSGASESCPEALSMAGVRALEIAQSGRFLTAKFQQGPKGTLSGVLDQRRFILCSVGDLSDACSRDSFHLNGGVLEQGGARRLELRLRPHAAGCGEVVLLSTWRPIKAAASPQRGYNY
jgi:hypothetical protein